MSRLAAALTCLACLAAHAPAVAASAERPLRLSTSLNEARGEARAPIDPAIADPSALRLQPSVRLDATNSLLSALGTGLRQWRQGVHTDLEGWQGWLSLALRLALVLLLLPLFKRAVLDLWRIFRCLLRSRAPQPLHMPEAGWPEVSLLLVNHPAGSSLSASLNKLLATDYPRDRLHIYPVFDASVNVTRSAIDRHVALNPKFIHPVHLADDDHTSWSALLTAADRLRGEVVILLDGPPPDGRQWLKGCITPFFDPLVAAVQAPTALPRRGVPVLAHLEKLARAVQGLRSELSRHTELLPGAQLCGLRTVMLSRARAMVDQPLPPEVALVRSLAAQGWACAWTTAMEPRETAAFSWSAQASRARHGPAMVTSSPVLTDAVPAREGQAPLAALLLSLFLLLTGDIAFATLGLAGVAATSFAVGGGHAGFITAGAVSRLHGRMLRLRLLPLMALVRLAETALALPGRVHLLAVKLTKQQRNDPPRTAMRPEGNPA